jgi:hypothetical protein
MILREENQAIVSPSLVVYGMNTLVLFLTRKELGRGQRLTNVSSNLTGIFYCTNHAYSLLFLDNADNNDSATE